MVFGLDLTLGVGTVGGGECLRGRPRRLGVDGGVLAGVTGCVLSGVTSGGGDGVLIFGGRPRGRLGVVGGVKSFRFGSCELPSCPH